MEGIKMSLWLLICWVVYASSRVDELDSRDVEENRALTIECHPEPIDKYHTRCWYRINTTTTKGSDDPDEIFRQYYMFPPEKRKAHRAGMTCNETSFELTINNILLEDYIFTCITDVQGALTVTQQPINVYRVGSLEMTGLEAPYYNEHDVVNVTCTYSEFYPEISNSKLKIKWGTDAPVTSINTTRGGEKYFTYTANMCNTSLERKDNNIEVKCSITPTIGTAPPPEVKTLNVHYHPVGSPTITINDTTPNQRESVKFTCDDTSLDVNPKPSLVNWSRDGQVLPAWPTGSVTHTIVVTVNDSGDFSCRMGNQAGYSAYANPVLLNVTEFYAPYDMPSLTTGKEEYRQRDSLTFTCYAKDIDAHPKVDRFNWTKDGQHNDWNTSIAKIPSLDSDRDNGTYKCFVGNRVGFSPSGGSIEIKVSPFYKLSGTPRLTIHPNDSTTGDKVTFNCDLDGVDGNPKLVKWTHDSSVLGDWPDDEVHFLTGLKETDAGSYACYIHNHLGDPVYSEVAELIVNSRSDGGGGDKPPITAGAVGGIVGAIMVIVIVTAIMAIILVKKYRTKPDDNARTDLSGTPMGQCNNGGDEALQIYEQPATPPIYLEITEPPYNGSGDDGGYVTPVKFPVKDGSGKDGGYVMPFQVLIKDAPTVYEPLAAPPVYSEIAEPIYSNQA